MMRTLSPIELTALRDILVWQYEGWLEIRRRIAALCPTEADALVSLGLISGARLTPKGKKLLARIDADRERLDRWKK